MPARKKPSSSSSQSNNNNNKRKRKDDVSSDEEESDHEELASQPLTANGTKKTKPNSICGYQLPKMRDGSIVRIKIHNFMTYDDCEFFPGPGLNLVLGPNGTGKSSIVGAICVGLAGHTKLLGRASRVSDMIKHGKSEAFVEIELKAAKKNVVIKRSFHLNKDNKESTDWRVNGTKKTGEEVRNIIEGFNIQLDNLTQFLPQEKVCEFAALDSTQRLEQTQLAVLSPEIIQHQQDLIKRQDEFKLSSNQLDTLTKQLEGLKKKNATLEKEVEKYNQRKKYLDEAELCKIKMPVLQFKNIQERGKQLKEMESKLAQEVASQQQEVGPLRDVMEELDRSIKKTDSDMRTDRNRINTNKEKISNVIQKFATSNNNIEKYSIEIEKAKQSEHAKQSKIQKLDQQIKQLETHLSKYNIPEIKGKIQEKNNEARDQDEEYRKIMDRKYELNESFKSKKEEMEECKRKIHKLDNVKEQRLRRLRENRLEQVVRVYEWYMQNRSQFLKPIYCIPLEIAPTTPLFGSFIEMHCPQYVFRSFVTQCIEDRERLQKYATENELRLSIILPDNLEYHPTRVYPTDQLKQYGFISYLDEQYTAPDAVKSCIKDLTQMDTVAVSENPNAKVSDLLMKSPIQCAFIPNQQYLMKTSTYDRSKSTRVVDVNPAQTEEELTEKIDFYLNEAEKITANASVLDEYAKRLREIEEKENQIKELENASETIAGIVEELKEKWLKPLRECVTKINDTFTEYCKHVGIAGEVTLVGDENNFKSFQIDIKVKFRDSEKLTSLSAQRQSGGERSVTTILYLLSLQQLNKSPFRVVDEINQGMDPQNERKIFYQMLDSSQGEDIPQSFLITPKLLPDLVPNNANNITVIFVFNGPANISQDEFAKFFQPFDKSMEIKGESSRKSVN
ncbi:structural maintenance of chromosome 5 [Naegleria gruberi]|uniref:Structural maintenance of chromosomes protein 5 n=1 Tax=Naegleria gruberi TaxID=5762 RepID=D2VKA9_NAEGR|nr:structural maintenance of chromosome 5 [Naegleria gruberi]EFC42567.1 structural maintenance of chromosome 5 [Naegleria gruberi]|eukprot:XP_002675311.1 structural maintenance of chromosome 5 [Naegleria gruberi strain NEG-M]